ncbi:unnamed protein product [Darwinula stevensoni]|uniref:Alpha-crystallin N-terminal domain-containing protein n=1 Tax=Darwinula stevensoni TaxID=69355 RepID=A0A7R9AAF0_9CRUS|nr:unnamed protein product [Darwinula stevensoni]CAG0897990.1 unnamed protein product [Darwinula stevensoni]
MDPVTRLFDQHFGMGLLNDDLLAPPTYHPFYIIARRPNRDRVKSGVSEVVNDKDKFQVGSGFAYPYSSLSSVVS